MAGLARIRGTLAFLLAIGLVLRLASAAGRGLWLDDFHSLHHARASDLGSFFASLARDNHPPLSFLLVRAARATLGEGEWALRAPALLAGMGTLWIVWRIGARLACPQGGAAATLLLAVSTLHIAVSSDVRMYALLALASAGLLDGLLARLEDGRGSGRIALWTAVGLHAHYHFLYMLAVLGATSLLLALAEARYRPALRPCVMAFAVAGLVSAPWYLSGFPAQLRHELAPGGSDAGVLRLVEGFKNMVFLNVSVAGSGLRWVGLGASALMLLLALSALVRLGRSARAGASLAWLGLAAAFAVPFVAWVAARLSPRAGFDWRYLSGSLPAFCLVLGTEACGAGRSAPWRRAALYGVALAALAVAVANVRHPGNEDYRGATRWILERATGADAVVAADWQPRVFPHALAWDYYAPRLAGGRPLPARLETTDELALAEPAALERYARVFCCLRSLPDGCALLRALRQRFPHEEKAAFGRAVHVHVYTRP